MKTFKYRLNPTKSQIRILEQQLDLCRWVYNKSLEARIDMYSYCKAHITKFDLHNHLIIWKEDYEELHLVYSQVLQNACARCHETFENFFRRRKNGEKPRFPRFKGKSGYDSFTYPQYKGGSFRIKNDGLLLSKIGCIKIILHRKIEGEIKTLTVKRDRLGRWFAFFSCDVSKNVLPKSKKIIGLDMGLIHIYTDSKGRKVKNPKFMKRDAKELQKYQSKIGKAQKGSKEYYKYLRKVQHINDRITNRRDDFAHQESRKLVNKYGVIAVEKLEIDKMKSKKTKNSYRSIRRGINDASWGKLIYYISYKAESAGRKFIAVDSKYTSQDCSRCGHRVKKSLKDRLHNCLNCGLILDRDHNSAREVLARGLTELGFFKALKALSLRS